MGDGSSWAFAVADVAGAVAAVVELEAGLGGACSSMPSSAAEATHRCCCSSTLGCISICLGYR